MATNGNSVIKKPPTKVTLEFPNRAQRHALEGGPYIIVYGTVGGGFLFTGVFETVGEAIDYAEMYLSAYNWEVATLQDPEEGK